VFGWAFQSAFTFAKIKSQTKEVKTTKVLLPKSSFHRSTNAKAHLPLLSVAFG
jgi:hypothetical protein